MTPTIRALIDDRLNELTFGAPIRSARAQLQQLAKDLPGAAKHHEFADACLAGLWLLHDSFDESHAISQDLHTLEGSYWHAILHRREPDYGNAKYWFRRVPSHPIFAELAKQAAAVTREMGTPTGSEFLVQQAKWDSAAFVDLCEKAARGPEPLARLCRRIQRVEWDLLFDYCVERARIETSRDR
jgi:hypothetical protein